MTKYQLQSRSNQTLAIIDPSLEDYEKFQATLRFNGLSTWALTLRRESRYASTFLPDSNKALNNGLLLFVDNEDGLPPVQLLSGPEDDFTLSRKEDSTGPLLVSGWSDEYWLQKRLALPTPGYAYTSFWGSSVTTQRFYALGEASGATATDTSGHSNGTYSGTVSYGQPGLIDDPTTCIKCDGSSTTVSVPTAGLQTANGAWTVFGWGMVTVNPAGNAVMWYFGTNAARQGLQMGINSSGQPFVAPLGAAATTGTTSVPLNTPFLLAAVWDGTTLTGYLNSTAFGSQTPGAFNVAYGGAFLGAFNGGTNFWTGWLGLCGFANTNWNSNPTNQISSLYLNGLSRQSFNSYDIPIVAMASSPLTASTMLIYYVQRNASATASPYAAYGSCAPTTTFQTALGTRYARQVPNLVCASDPQVGSKVYAAGRFDPLLSLLPAIAVQSNPEVGFRLVQVGQQLQFQTYLPTDRTATAIFSLDRGNLRSYDWQYGRSSANYLFTGGLNASTSLSSRTFGEAGDATSIGQFGLIEDFFDYRKTQDTVTLANVMQAQLVKLRARRNINAVVNDTPKLYLAGPGVNGYNLGDRVTVTMEDGNSYSDIVREVSIELQPGQPAKVTAAIGTPIDAAILGELDTIAKRFKDDGINIDVMQNNY